MHIVDTNIILRYLLQDNEKLSKQALEIIENNVVYTTTEVVAEICYVLAKVYDITRADIATELRYLFEDNIIQHNESDFIINAIDIFENTRLDFVDCVMISYHKTFGYKVTSFDKKIQRHIKNLKQ